MSHTIQDVVNIMRRLDKQTGYNISGLPIKHKKFMSSLACCEQKRDQNRIEYPCSFEFSSQALNMDNEEFEQVVIHEYAHAYVSFESQRTGEPVEFNHHGEQFRYAVKKLGGWFICPTIEESYWEKERQKIRDEVLSNKETLKLHKIMSERKKEMNLLQEKPYTLYTIERIKYKQYHNDELRYDKVFYRSLTPLRTKTGKGRYKTIIDNLKQDDEVYFVDNCIYLIIDKTEEYYY